MTFRAIRTLPLLITIFLLMQVFVVAEASAAGRYIVVLRDGASPAAAAKRHGAAPEFTYTAAIRGYAATLSDAALAKAKADPAVDFISIDRVISLGKPGGGGSGTGSSGQDIPTGIRRIGMEPRLTGVNYSVAGQVDVAVIDTGIDLDHPDLNAQAGANCSSGTTADDGNGHGTHVAGTIAAEDNAIGVVGVAPGATVWAYRVLNNAGSGTTSSVICGLLEAAKNPVIDVVNMSIGGAGSVPTGTTCLTTGDAYYKAVCALHDKGVTVVVAAGNSDTDASSSVPAAFGEAITVSAWADFDGTPTGTFTGTPCRTDGEETFANFSNYGTVVDLTAPGVCIKSTWKGGGYNTISGTSMAAPHVAGAAALWRALHSYETPKATLLSTEQQLLESVETRPLTDDPDDIAEGLLSVRAASWN